MSGYDDSSELGGKQVHNINEWHRYVTAVQDATNSLRGEASKIASRIRPCVGKSLKRATNPGVIKRCIAKSKKSKKSKRSGKKAGRR